MNYKDLKTKVSKKEKEPFVVRLQRPTSIYLTKFLIKTELKANNITNLMTIIGLISVYFFSTGEYIHSIIGVVIWHLHLLIDLIDGNIARYWNQTSNKGIYLDTLSHKTVFSLFWVLTGYGLFLKTSNEIYILIGGLIVIFTSVTKILQFEAERLINKKISRKNIVNEIKTSKSITTIMEQTYNFLNNSIHYMMIIFTLINKLEWFLIFEVIYNGIIFIYFSLIIYPRQIKN